MVKQQRLLSLLRAQAQLNDAALILQRVVADEQAEESDSDSDSEILDEEAQDEAAEELMGLGEEDIAVALLKEANQTHILALYIDNHDPTERRMLPNEEEDDDDEFEFELESDDEGCMDVEYKDDTDDDTDVKDEVLAADGPQTSKHNEAGKEQGLAAMDAKTDTAPNKVYESSGSLQ